MKKLLTGALIALVPISVSAGSINIINLTGSPVVLNHFVFNNVSNPLVPVSPVASYTTAPIGGYLLPVGSTSFFASPHSMITAVVGGPALPAANYSSTAAFLHDLTFIVGGCDLGIGYEHGPSGPNTTIIKCGVTVTYTITNPSTNDVEVRIM